MQLPADYAKASIKIALLAGEPSGDELGSGLIQALKVRWPQAHFVGIGGPKMIAAGLCTLYPMERLSVMGLFEPFKRAFELLHLRRSLKKLFIHNPPDLFIGIDAPDFNLNLEKALKSKGITTMHYVSPTIWAWRKGRIKSIRKAVEHMLLIFPFEKSIYDLQKIPATFVGHRLAGSYPLIKEKEAARKILGIESSVQVLALLVGSRSSEVERLGSMFIETALAVNQLRPDIKIIAAMQNQTFADKFQKILSKYPSLSIDIRVDRTPLVLQAADIAMIKSGTATLEASLAKTPHIVVYKTSWLTFQIAKRLIVTKHISMTNIMAGKALVEEYIQEACNADKMASALIGLLEPAKQAKLEVSFTQMHQDLKCDTDQVAANAIVHIIQRKQANDCRC